MPSEAPAERGGGGPAQAQRQRDRDEAVEEIVAVGGKCDEALKTRLVDLDVAGRGGEDLAAINQKGLRSIGSDRHLAGDGDGRPVEHAVRDFDAARALRIESLPPTQVEQAGLEPLLLVRECTAAR